MKFLILQLSSNNCPHCPDVKMVLMNLCKKYDISFMELNVDENPYGLAVMKKYGLVFPKIINGKPTFDNFYYITPQVLLLNIYEKTDLEDAKIIQELKEKTPERIEEKEDRNEVLLYQYLYTPVNVRSINDIDKVVALRLAEMITGLRDEYINLIADSLALYHPETQVPLFEYYSKLKNYFVRILDKFEREVEGFRRDMSVKEMKIMLKKVLAKVDEMKRRRLITKRMYEYTVLVYLSNLLKLMIKYPMLRSFALQSQKKQ